MDQVGTAVEVGIGGFTFGGVIVESAGSEKSIESEVILDEENEPTTRLSWGAKETLTVEGIIKGTGFTEPSPGDTVTINGIAGFCEKVSVKRERKAAKVTITVIKDAITYS
jgi:hypothetical protein